MKLILIITTTIFFGVFNTQDTPSDFDYKLSSIARNFRSDIMNEEGCEKQKTAAYELADEIEEAIESDEYTSEEILELKKLKKETEALEEYIGVIGNIGNYNLSISDFNLINRRVNANISSVIRDKYCVDVILITIGDYAVYLAENDSSKNYKISYNWKAKKGMNTGSGNMGLWKYSMRHIYDNRENPTQKNISIFGITCKEF